MEPNLCVRARNLNRGAPVFGASWAVCCPCPLWSQDLSVSVCAVVPLPVAFGVSQRTRSVPVPIWVARSVSQNPPLPGYVTPPPPRQYLPGVASCVRAPSNTPAFACACRPDAPHHRACDTAPKLCGLACDALCPCVKSPCQTVIAWRRVSGLNSHRPPSNPSFSPFFLLLSPTAPPLLLISVLCSLRV